MASRLLFVFPDIVHDLCHRKIAGHARGLSENDRDLYDHFSSSLAHAIRGHGNRLGNSGASLEERGEEEAGLGMGRPEIVQGVTDTGGRVSEQKDFLGGQTKGQEGETWKQLTSQEGGPCQVEERPPWILEVGAGVEIEAGVVVLGARGWLVLDHRRRSSLGMLGFV